MVRRGSKTDDVPEEYRQAAKALHKGEKQGVHSAIVALGDYRVVNCDPDALDRWSMESEIDADEDVSMF